MTKSFMERFQPQATRLAEAGPEWLQQQRARARETFDRVGLPATTQEEWRGTSVGALSTTEFVPAPESAEAARFTPATQIPAIGQLDLGGPVLTFVDGRYASELSTATELPDGCWVGTLADALEQIPDQIRKLRENSPTTAGIAFEAMNDAVGEEGCVVWVPDGAELPAPVQLRYLSGNSAETTASHPRTLIFAGRNARCQVVESYLGVAPAIYLTNAVTHVRVGDNGHVDHIRVEQESAEAFHVATLHSHQGRDSHYVQHNITLGGKWVRNHVTSVLDGEGANGQLYGLYVTRHQQHVDNHTILDHAKPHGDTRELYKGILAESSRSVFTGRIIVREDSQQTDAKQSNPNLLLSPQALAQTRPQLEIYADDVKCTHGATIGQMDEKAIFYLRSRGISNETARRMMIQAYAGEVLETIAIEPVRDLLNLEVERRLPDLDEAK